MKNPLFSKTIQGILLMILPHLLARFGFKFDEAQTQGLIEDILMAVGGLWGIYGRFKAEVPLKNPLASDKLPGAGLLLLSTLILQLSTGCATWEGLSANQQAALKAVAKTAVIFGLNQLGDSVKELRPYQPALLGVINATFSATDNAASLGTALKAGIETVVQDPVLRAQVLGAIRAQLAGASAASAGDLQSPLQRDHQQRFNAALTAKL